jgi:hypothetical protein
MSRRTITIGLIFVGVVAACGGLQHWFLKWASKSEQGANLAQVSWLPQEATNVSFHRRNYGYQAYEFDISESGFRQWVEYPVKEIDQPFSIWRYSLPDCDRANEMYTSSTTPCTAVIRSGLYYEQVWSDGGRVAVAYDREHGRAYFQTNPR